MYVTSAEQLEKRNQDVAMRDEQRKARRRAKGVGSSEEDSSDDGESKGDDVDDGFDMRSNAMRQLRGGGDEDEEEEEERVVKGKGVAGLLGDDFEVANLNAKVRRRGWFPSLLAPLLLAGKPGRVPSRLAPGLCLLSPRLAHQRPESDPELHHRREREG